MTLGLVPGHDTVDGPGPALDASGRRLVEVAVDAAGAGGAHPYTYAVPDELADLENGEAVLVEFGRRQALGIVLGSPDATPGRGGTGGGEPKPIIDRVRADGPLLPGLTLSLARWIAQHYLAPPALVFRSMLPPGLLERLELVAERTPQAIAGPDGSGALDAADADLLDQLDAGARPARELAAPDGRAGLLRRLRGLAGSGLITLDWTLLGASAGPRYERWVGLTTEGAAVADTLAAGGRPAGRPL
jgi:primosomal protein N'